MDIENTTHLEEGVLDDLWQSERAVDESFESLLKIVDSQTILENFILERNNDRASFESNIKPIVAAISAGTDLIEFQAESVSFENAVDMAKAFGRALMAAIRSFFINLLEYLANVDVAAAWLSRKVTVIERQVLSSRGKVPSEQQVDLGRLNRYLRVGRLFADDSLKLERALADLIKALNITRQDQVPAVLDFAEKIPATVGKLTGGELDKALVQLVLSMPNEALVSKYGMSASEKGRFNGNVVGTSPLIGGYSVFYMRGDLLHKGTKGLRFHGMMADSSTEEHHKFQEHRRFRTLAPTDLGAIPKQVREILDIISRTNNSSVRSKITRVRSALENFVNKCSQDDRLTQSDLDAIRRTVTSFTGWTHSVSRPLNSSALSVCRAVLSYCDISIKTYK